MAALPDSSPRPDPQAMLRAEMKLRADHVSIHYWLARSGRAFCAVDDINLGIQPAEFIAILGPSGCGKTTFLNAVAGLEAISAGTLTLNGQPIAGPGADRAMVFQQASLLPWRTVLGNIVYGAEIQGRDTKAERVRRATQYMDLVGLSGFGESYPSELSGGMQQRVNLARALTLGPDMLLLDEPFAALDAQTREIMQSELLRIWSNTGTTAVFITHDIKEAIYLADRVVVFTARPGRIKTIVDIELPRPRELAVKRHPRFLEYEDHLWNCLADEVKAAMAAERTRD